MKISVSEIKKIQKKILQWYKEHKADFPWRQTRDPYHIWVSEIMLQQTQVNRVIPKFAPWIQTFPTVESLAKASVRDILTQWSGLGYNRRALFLKKAAQMIVEKYNGKFPDDEKLLRSLPGIGKYTARAILCFAFDKQIAVVDTNVRKVIISEFYISHTKEVQNIADQLLPKGRAHEWNQALMDYSRTMLKQYKIQIPKQSKFIGSHRYYRGQILKTLVRKKEVALKDLGVFIKKDYTSGDKQWLQNLVSELKDEGFVQWKQNKVSLRTAINPE